MIRTLSPALAWTADQSVPGLAAPWQTVWACAGRLLLAGLVAAAVTMVAGSQAEAGSRFGLGVDSDGDFTFYFSGGHGYKSYHKYRHHHRHYYKKHNYYRGHGYKGHYYRGGYGGHGGAHFGNPYRTKHHHYQHRPSRCHPVSKHGLWHGRQAKIGGTMCYDGYGNSYVVPGSRHLIHYY